MESVPDFSTIRILCLGDVILDRFVHGDVARLSPEAPVPVVRVASETLFPGGAANVGRNIAALGGSCTLVGVVGDDTAGDSLRDALRDIVEIDARLIRASGRRTTEKLRYVAQRRQLLRADREQTDALSYDIDAAVRAAVKAGLADADVLLISDYAKGVCSDAMLRWSISTARAAGIPVVVDPKSTRFERYRGASLIAPNLSELEAAAGRSARSDAQVAAVARSLLDAAGIEAMLVTRAEKGLMLIREGQAELMVPARAREVSDVAGAGDTVVGAFALALGAGVELDQAARIANAAAGVVVSKAGTATATRAEVLVELGITAAREMSLDQAVASCAAWRGEGLRIGLANGCFDLLHAGHVALLDYARAQCDRLVVAINSDASVARLKGAGRPIHPVADRVRTLLALRSVDAVVIFDADTPFDTIAALEPDVLVKGADYRVADVIGADLVQARGGTVALCPLVPGFSTTAVLAQVGAD